MISIIVPTYNEEKGIEKMVLQFRELKVPHEVIVSDTQSTDKTVEAASRVTDKVITLSPTEKRGVSKGRNNGALLASGDLLAFMDCDTKVPDPNRFFERVAARFANDPKLMGASVRIEVSREVRTWSDAAVSSLMNGWFFIVNKFFGIGIASGKFIIVRAAAFRDAEGFNENISTAEDMDFFGRLRKLGHTRIIWDLAVYHSGRRFHQQGAWHTLFLWIKNAVSFWLFRRPSDKWEPIR